MTQKERFEASGDHHAGAAGEGNRDASPAASDQSDSDFARMLRAKRDERRLSLDDCGQALRLPVRLLRQIEAGDYGGIDYQVYLRGYLLKYGRYLDVPDAAVEAELQRLTPRQPALVSTGGVSRSRYLLERYAQAASYIVLTVVILVPVVWFGLRGGLQKGASLIPLDSAPVAMSGSHDTAAPDHAASQASRSTSRQHGLDRDPRPMLASIAPFAAMRADDEATAVPTTTVPTPASPTTQTPAAPADATGLSIHLDGASWVEITNSKGQHLEYALLPAGTKKTYSGSNARTLNVRVGNADAATITVAGKIVDLAPYQHANVAHFDVNTRSGKTTPTEN